MRKLSILLLIIFACIAGALSVFALFWRKSPVIKQEQVFVPATVPETTFWFDPSQIRITPTDFNNRIQATVEMNTQENQVSGIQLEFKFDPLSLENLTISPASNSAFLTPGYKVLYNHVNNATGRISFFISFKDTHNNGISAPVALLSFTPLVGSNAAKIVFLDKTMASEPFTHLSVLKNTSPLSVLFQ